MGRSPVCRPLTMVWLASWATLALAPIAALAAPQAGSEQDHGSASSGATIEREEPAVLLDRGIALLTGPGSDEEALAAFLAAAESSERPASAWLWAAAAAERLGRFEEAGTYKARALGPVPPPPPAAASASPAPAARVLPSEDPPVPPAVAAPALPEPEPTAVKPKPPEPEPAQAGVKANAEQGEQKADEKRAGDEKAKVQEKEEMKADAFQYFFGKRAKPKAETERPPAEDEEPAEPPAR
jgi:hypothetical protein